MKQLSIGLVLDDSLDRPDGVQQYVLTLGCWLTEQGHNVHYLAGGPHKNEDADVHVLSKNVHVRFNGNRLSIPLPANQAKIKNLLTSLKLDVLHVQLPCSPWLAGRVVMAAAPETAVVGTFHIVPKSQIARQSSRGLALYEHKLLKRFQTVISVSPAAQTFARQVYGLTCIVEPNVIDLIPYRQVPGKSAGNQIVTIVFLGRLVERKGCEYLLRAIVELKDRPQLKPFRVLIGGRGPLEPRLKRFAWDHGLNKLVEFNGFIDEADKPEFLAQADLAIFPSTAGESFGIVLLEAMAAAPGVVLAGDNEGYASVMQPHIEQLFAPRQSQLLAEKIAYYIQNKSARQAAHRWQTRHVEQFDVNVVGPRIIDLYNQALRHRRDVR